MEDKKPFLVPYDFSVVADNAVQHAIFLAKQIGGSIQLFHIVDKEDKVADMQAQLDRIIPSFDKGGSAIEITGSIGVGSIFSDIVKTAEDAHARLVVMGTHGVRGLQQKLLGAHAVKVITGSPVPFMVVQQKPTHGIEKIVIPLTLVKESVQAVNFSTELAQKFQADIHIVGEGHKDPHLRNKVDNNIKVVLKVLSDKGVNIKAVRLEGKEAFHKEVINYGKKIDADLFAISLFDEFVLASFDTFTESLINNEPEIPVMVINAKQTYQYGIISPELRII